jgi:hypothetical protein
MQDVKRNPYYAELRRELAVAMGEMAVTCPQNLWSRWIVYMLEELELEAKSLEEFEETLKAIRDDIEARLITGQWGK